MRATAKQTVLNKVPGATAANIYEWKLDFDDGRWEYDGKIVYNLMEYDFTVDASSAQSQSGCGVYLRLKIKNFPAAA